MQKREKEKAEEGDLRIRRTRHLLQKALLELTIEKGFAGLSVQDISERAMVNRSTFYRHYLDKYDLLERYMEEVFELTALADAAGTEAEIGERSENPPERSDQTPAGLIRLLEHVGQNAPFYRAMLGKEGDPAFARQITEYIEKRFRQLLPDDLVASTAQNQPPLALSLSYVAYAGVGALVWWLEHDLPCSAPELASWLNRFSQQDLSLAL